MHEALVLRLVHSVLRGCIVSPASQFPVPKCITGSVILD